MDINAMALNEIWQEIEKRANERPDLLKDLHASYIFEITGEDAGIYGLIFKGGLVAVDKNGKNKPDCTLTMDVDNFKKLLQGNLNATSAYMTGRVKVKGNIGLALKLESLLKKFDI